MSELGFPWDNGIEPFFVNEEGFEWYHDKDCTEWAHREDKNGISLPNVFVCLVKNGDHVNRVIVDNNQNVLYSSQQMEAVAVHIDMLKASKNYENYEKQD